ncbi:MAG TPA: hypothetical protein PKH07_04295 [bacterium]|nr:hypothetical protein [bacterium]
MKKVQFLSMIFLGLCLTASAAFAGTNWHDWFDGYANQAALEANWPAAGGYAAGQLDTARVLSTAQSMRCEQSPTATRPTRSLQDSGAAQNGTLTLWVYDDGADLKQFDVRINQNAPAYYVALGLRDDQTGSQTNYTCNINGTVSSTGIPRSTGWHLFQIQCFAGATTMKIDGKTFAGNSATGMKGDLVTIDTTFGSSANQVWVDSAGWMYTTAADRNLSAVSETYILDYGFEKDAANWSGVGTNSTFHAKDDGCQSIAGCLDSHNGSGTGLPYAFQGSVTATVAQGGSYKMGFYYMNGPHSFDGINDLSVSVNGQGLVNLGSGNLATDQWVYSYGETGTFTLGPGSNALTIAVGGTNQGANSLARWDHFNLILVTGIEEWSQY